MFYLIKKNGKKKEYGYLDIYQMLKEMFNSVGEEDHSSYASLISLNFFKEKTEDFEMTVEEFYNYVYSVLESMDKEFALNFKKHYINSETIDVTENEQVIGVYDSGILYEMLSMLFELSDAAEAEFYASEALNKIDDAVIGKTAIANDDLREMIEDTVLTYNKHACKYLMLNWEDMTYFNSTI